jgi:8-oxo-dGTP pyrophosphatase MutT (NUDIX family)
MTPPRSSAAGTVTDPILAAGVVLWASGEKGPKFLLLQNSNHQTWGLSKGHRDGQEGLLETALRETQEETGYELTEKHLLPDFADTSIYQHKPDLWKRVVTFLSAHPVIPAELVISTEHCDFAWLELPAALKAVQFPALQRTLSRAAIRLKKLQAEGPCPNRS